MNASITWEKLVSELICRSKASAWCIRFNVHNELRFPLGLTTKPPWMRIVPRSEEEEKIDVNHDYLSQKHMEDHFEADTKVLSADRQTPATFVPL